MAKDRRTPKKRKLREQSRRLRDGMTWLLRGFTLQDPRKNYPGFYLSPQQSYVLAVIQRWGSISPGEVAKELRLEKSHLTKIVNSLIQMGAVEKRIDDTDRRRLVLTLTEKGRQVYKDLDKLGVDSYVELMELVPEGEREKVIRATEVLLDAMQELRRKMGIGIQHSKRGGGD